MWQWRNLADAILTKWLKIISSVVKHINIMYLLTEKGTASVVWYVCHMWKYQIPKLGNILEEREREEKGMRKMEEEGMEGGKRITIDGALD